MKSSLLKNTYAAILVATGAMSLFPVASLSADEKPKDAKPKEASVPQSVHDFKVKDTDGKELDLASLKGKVLMIVNVASL